MADLGTIALDRYDTGRSSNTAIVGTQPVLETIAATDDLTYVHDTSNTTHTGIATFDIADLPADFQSMESLAVKMRYGLSAPKGNNSWTQLWASVKQTHSKTALTNGAAAAENIINTTPADSAAVSLTGVVPGDRTVWNAAVVEVRFFITRSGGGDSVQERVYAAELTGTYTPITTVPSLVITVAYWVVNNVLLTTAPWASQNINDVLWVDIQYHGTNGESWWRRLQGSDNYWVDPPTFRYGMFIDAANAAWYGDTTPRAWQVSDAGETDLGAVTPTDLGISPRVLRGVYIGDTSAQTIGLIDTPDAPKP